MKKPMIAPIATPITSTPSWVAQQKAVDAYAAQPAAMMAAGSSLFLGTQPAAAVDAAGAGDHAVARARLRAHALLARRPLARSGVRARRGALGHEPAVSPVVLFTGHLERVPRTARPVRVGRRPGTEPGARREQRADGRARHGGGRLTYDRGK